MRLDRLISSQKKGISRSDVKKLCLKGKVSVNGRTVKKADMQISEEDEITVNGEKLEYKEFIYIMMNKPKGVVCSNKDGVSQTVMELVPDEFYRKGIFPAGRLDKDTEGFVLITNDGKFAHKMLSPKNHVEKTYFVRLENHWEEGYKQAFESGIVIKDNGEDYKCLAAKFYGDIGNKRECEVKICEGKFHQVKKMFEALGNKVVYLKRTAIGEIALDSNLREGECLELLHKDVEKLLTFRR